MKKSVQIVTFHNAYNYGAVLQCYALKEVIKQLGNDCTVFNHQNAVINKLYIPKLFLTNVSWKEVILNFLNYPKKVRKHRVFKPFIENELLKDGSSKCHENTLYICGSDQVWNYRLTDFDKAYFLDFADEPKQRNAFSASFGFAEIPDEHKKEYKRLLSGFNHISVREQQGAVILKDLLGIDVPVTLDPTMLLTKDQWAQLTANTTEKKEDRYILLYLMSETEELFSFADRLREVTGLEIRYVCINPSRKMRKLSNVTYKSFVSPQEWVDLFLNATYVITNSFHGLAFSINFNKNVFIGYLPQTSAVNSRLQNLIHLFDLEHRLVSNVSIENCQEAIDYTDINRRLAIGREQSLDYLRGILDE